MKLSKTWFLNGVLILGSLAAALAVTEVAVRYLLPQPTGLSYQDRYGLALHYPGITRYLPQFGHEVTFNSVGMRDVEHPLEKPAGVFRILLLGDSFMEGLQVPFEGSLPYLLEQSLGPQNGKRVEVLNAGVGGWGTDDELRYLTAYGLQYRPDLVVIAMTLHNDLSDNLRKAWHKLDNGVLVDQPTAPASWPRYKVTQLKAFLASRFQLYQLWRRVRHGGEIRQVGRALSAHVVQLFRVPNSPRIAEGLALTGQLLSAIKDTTASVGGRVAIVMLPLKYQLSDTIFAALVRTAGVPADSMQLLKPQAMVTRVADSLGIPVVDLLPGFRQWTADSTAPLYLDWDGHWNAAGHRLAAREAAEGLVRTGAVH